MGRRSQGRVPYGFRSAGRVAIACRYDWSWVGYVGIQSV